MRRVVARVETAIAVDVAVVVSFVAIGRRNHDESPGLGGLFETAAPFLLGLVLGWVVARVWRSPIAVRTGLIVAAVTLAAGMLCRRFLFDDGTALSFVIVAAVFLFTFFLTWRAAALTLVTPATGD